MSRIVAFGGPLARDLPVPKYSREEPSLSLKSKILYLSQGLVFIQVPVRHAHRRHADRLREPDPTTMWYLQIGPEVEKIR